MHKTATTHFMNTLANWTDALRALVTLHMTQPTQPALADLADPAHTLALAEALLDALPLHEKCELNPDLRHIAFIGPTQSGKSTLINALLKADLAVPSPLAGYTQHAIGFALGETSPEELESVLSAYFYPAVAKDPSLLGMNDPTAHFGYRFTSLDNAFGLNDAVIWDTPDFDSLASGAYRTGLLRVLGLADICVLVLSKEKYADQVVWNLLSLLEPLGLPTLIALNKVPEGYETLLQQSFTNRWQHHRSDRMPPLYCLPYTTETLEDLPALVNFRQILTRIAPQAQHARRSEFVQFCTRNWQNWLAPLHAEEHSRHIWSQDLNSLGDRFLDQYTQHYLDHPVHYASFQQAMAEMLRLLEIPGLAGSLGRLRSYLTWPARQFGKSARSALGNPQDLDVEKQLLRQIALDSLLALGTQLDRLAHDDTSTTLWDTLHKQLRLEQTELLQRFSLAVDDYVSGFREEIDRTALTLHKRLSEQPALLNSLRATRMATDVTALALALHTGGIGLQDFILAPASLGLTTLLTESALGKYIDHAAIQLKAKQRQAVALLISNHLLQPLHQWLPERKTPNGEPLSIARLNTLLQAGLT